MPQGAGHRVRRPNNSDRFTLATAKDWSERDTDVDRDLAVVFDAMDHRKPQIDLGFLLYGNKAENGDAHHAVYLPPQGQNVGHSDQPRPDRLFQPFGSAHQGDLHVPFGMPRSRYLEAARTPLYRSHDALSRTDDRAPSRPGSQVRHLYQSSENSLKKLTKTEVSVENYINLTQSEIMAEKPTGYRPGLRDALAGLSMSVLASQAAAEAPAKVDGAAANTRAAITDCVVDGKAYRKEWLMERAQEEGVTRSKLKAWLGETMKTDDFKTAMSERFNDCSLANLEVKRAEQEIQLAALDERIAVARDAFAENGFDLTETEDGTLILKRNGQLAAIFVQTVPVAEDGTVGSSEWKLDFSPLEEINDELRDEIDAIWQQIEDRALGKTAELSVDGETERIGG